MADCYDRVVRSLNDLVNHRDDPTVMGFVQQLYLRYPEGVDMRGPSALAHDAEMWQKELNLMLSAHVFDIPSEVGYLMEGTDNSPHEVRLPFDNIFLDVRFQVKQHGKVWKFAGLLLLADWQPSELGVGTILAVAFGEGGEQGPFPQVVDVYFTIGPGAREDTLRRWSDAPREHMLVMLAEQTAMQNLVMNFCDLLEAKGDVRLVEVDSSARRERKGKLPIAAKTIVRLCPELHAYVNRMMSGEKQKLSHQFDVRGYWYHYRSERWRPELQGTRRWVPPSRRGEGLYIPKGYLVPPSRAEEVPSLPAA